MLYRLCCIASTRPLKTRSKKFAGAIFWSITLPKVISKIKIASVAWIDVIGLSNLAGNHITYYQAGKSKPTNLCVQLYSDYYGILKKKF